MGKSNTVIESGNPCLLKYSVREGKEYGLRLLFNFGTSRKSGTSYRRSERLSLRIYANPRDGEQRQHNKDVLALARQIRYEREQEFMQQREGYRLRKDTRMFFADFFQVYIDNYTKKDIRMVKIARSRFEDFLKSSGIHGDVLMCDAITPSMMKKFAEYLQTRSVGEGAKSILQRFKKVVRNCVEQGYIKNDPCNGVRCVVDEQTLKKDVLSVEEIEKLIATHYPNEKPAIRNAFIFCLYTGMRWCDVKDLRFSSIDYSNKLLRFEQDKTKGHSSRSWVAIPLSDGLLKLVGQPPEVEGKDALVFDLRTYEACNKAIKRWVKAAAIDKRISWHCARHSFAVNILNNGANIKTVSSLLGHSSLRHTEKYTRVVDKLKEDAINSLPELKL